MAEPGRHSLRGLCDSVKNLSLWQTFLFLLWLSIFLLHKSTGSVLEYLESCFFDSLADDAPDSPESHPGDGNAGSSTVGERREVPEAGSSSLIPSLPDEIVQRHVWPRLVEPPSVQLLLHLRHLSLSWHRFLNTTLEWSTLMFLRLDWPGYLRCATLSREIIASMTDRYRDELTNYRILIAEDMVEVESRVRYTRLRERSMPFYVTLDSSPPDVMVCPEYYGL